MLDAVFGGLLGISLLWGMARGTGGDVMAAALQAAGEGVETALKLAGGFAFFSGLMGILRSSGVMEGLARRLRPTLRWLFGSGLPEDAAPYVTLNLAANLMGLGNAATPMGVEAARRMAAGEAAGAALCLFLVVNSSSVQLLPSSVIALRAAAGSRDPGSIILPTLLATGISTLVGVAGCKLAERIHG